MYYIKYILTQNIHYKTIRKKIVQYKAIYNISNNSKYSSVTKLTLINKFISTLSIFKNKHS